MQSYCRNVIEIEHLRESIHIYTRLIINMPLCDLDDSLWKIPDPKPDVPIEILEWLFSEAFKNLPFGTVSLWAVGTS